MIIDSNKSIRHNMNANLLFVFKYIKKNKIIIAAIILIYLIFICGISHIVKQASKIKKATNNEEKYI
jgi:hypothetical protein